MEAVRAERAAEEGRAGAGVRGLGPRERLLVGREAGGGQVGGVADIVILILHNIFVDTQKKFDAINIKGKVLSSRSILCFVPQ